MHLLLLTEAAVPVVGGMFLEITTPVLALMIIAALLHDAMIFGISAMWLRSAR